MVAMDEAAWLLVFAVVFFLTIVIVFGWWRR
jgi:hypothetical protein